MGVAPTLSRFTASRDVLAVLHRPTTILAWIAGRSRLFSVLRDTCPRCPSGVRAGLTMPKIITMALVSYYERPSHLDTLGNFYTVDGTLGRSRHP